MKQYAQYDVVDHKTYNLRMRVVLDTNIIISGLFWTGTPSLLIKYILQSHTLCFTSETLGELEKVLTYEKFKPRIAQLSFTIPAFIDTLTKHAFVVGKPSYQIQIIQQDPDDNKFLEAALATCTDVIVSGDIHLLGLKQFEGIPIMRSTAFLKRFCKHNTTRD